MSYKKNSNYSENVVSVYGANFPTDVIDTEEEDEDPGSPPPPTKKKKTKTPINERYEIDGLRRTPIDEFNIVPVKDVIRSFKSSSQTTLTQIFGRDALSSSDTDSNFEPKRKKRLHPARIVTPAVKKLKPEVNPDWGGRRESEFDATLAQRGDLVTSTAKELHHPRRIFGDIDAG